MLDQAIYIEQLQRWLNRFNKCYFEIIKQDESNITEEYIKFDDWWIQFEELRKLINNKCIETKSIYKD